VIIVSRAWPHKRAVVPIFDFFRIVDGEIKEIRPYFDPKPLKEAA